MASRSASAPGTGPGDRQAGGPGGTAGSLRRGGARGNNYKTVASIPSKFETVINTEAKAKDGFGSSSYRMPYAESDIPGPGAYISVGQASHMVKRTDSISKKGYGNGFASGGRRLPRDDAFRGPGPGKYGGGAETARRDFNRAKTTGSFARPLENLGPPLEPRVDKRAMPGPGAYSPITGGHVAVRSAFRSGTDRFGERAASAGSAAPSPGTYNVHVVCSSFRPIAGRHASPSAAFKSSGRGGGKNGARRSAVPSIVYEGGGGGGGDTNGSPGPGEYGVGFDRDETAFRLLLQRAGRSSAAFARTTDDRFGRSTLGRVKHEGNPGPGAYEAPSALHERRAVVGPFKSTSDRIGTAGGKATAAPPGPAFYNPGMVGKKSFHLNAQKRFV